MNAQQPTDANQLEDLFASLRGNDQHVVGESEPESIAPAAESSPLEADQSTSHSEDSLDDLRRQLDKWNVESGEPMEEAAASPVESPIGLASELLNSEIFKNNESGESAETSRSLEEVAAQQAQPEPIDSAALEAGIVPDSQISRALDSCLLYTSPSPRD